MCGDQSSFKLLFIFFGNILLFEIMLISLVESIEVRV